MAAQLILDLPVRTALGREDFFVSPANATAVGMVETAAAWPEGKLVLLGPEGSGKTHLAAIWAADNAAPVCTAAAAGLPDPAPALVIEDVDRICGDLAAETALFHLHNAQLAAGGLLLMTSAASPQGLPFALPDLASRLRATAVARLDAPDDALLAAVLVKLFADRQLVVSPAVVPWLVSRIERSFAAARAIVADLDAAALRDGRRVTRALAAAVLDSRGGATA